MSRLPLIGVTTCSRQVGLHACSVSGDRSFQAVTTATPGMLAFLAGPLPPSDILDAQTGILFASLPLNVELFREHHQGSVHGPNAVHDAAGDAQWAVSSRLCMKSLDTCLKISHTEPNPHYLVMFPVFGNTCRARATQRDADASNNA
ncbi:glutamine amidotransferase [Pseudomonas citri]|uniref:glutamine amidotransferase n=1 Tax=Pseudomonas citri TaxID=2978349 RepID=UPI0021B696F2|nr:glutamine amidotransferase [Pseudomonas citri]